MAEVKNTITLRSKWAKHVQEMIDRHGTGAGTSNVAVNSIAIPRVAKSLLNVKPEAYIPRYVSLGPYHHSYFGSSSGENSSHHCGLNMSSAELYKVNSAAALWQNPRFHHNKSFSAIVQMVENMTPNMERFYDWHIMEGDYSKHFALMMAVDSSFLLRFLLNFPQFDDEPQLQYEDMIHSSLLHICIKCDIMKLENQIPFSVLERLFEAFESEDRRIEKFNQLLQMVLYSFVPFEFRFVVREIITITEAHLLGCMHTFISPMLRMESNSRDDTSHQRTLYGFVEIFVRVMVNFLFSQVSFANAFASPSEYHAGRLTKAGIKFKPLSVKEGKILFDKYSGTLYLPAIKINVSNMETEVFLRNMVALELNDASRGYYVTRYVGLMRCLIDTSHDVRLLRDSHVIMSTLSCTDEDIAKMWDGICQSLFTGHREIPREIELPVWDALIKDHMKKYYWRMVKEKLRELGEFLSSWKFVAPMSAFIALVLTAIQTYCTVADWLRSSKH